MRRGRRGLAGALLPFVLLVHWVGSAAAHTGGTTGFARVTVEGETVRYSLTLDLEAASKVQNGPLAADPDALAGIVARHIEISADGTPCAALPGTVQPAQPGRQRQGGRIMH